MNDLLRVRLKVIDRGPEAAVTILYSKEGVDGEQHLYLKVDPTGHLHGERTELRCHSAALPVYRAPPTSQLIPVAYLYTLVLRSGAEMGRAGQ